MVNWNDAAQRAQRRYDALIRKAHRETKKGTRQMLRPVEKAEREEKGGQYYEIPN